MSLYDVYVDKVNGEKFSLEELKGHPLLIVNIASKCGFTPQLDGLEKLYEEFKDQGLKILGFPSNQFFKQSPGTNEELLEFCQLNYGVTFDVFGKLDVKGKKQSDLYKHLIENTPKGKGKNVKWNFEKFLVNKEGEIVGRYAPNIKPEALVEDIRNIL